MRIHPDSQNHSYALTFTFTQDRLKSFLGIISLQSDYLNLFLSAFKFKAMFLSMPSFFRHWWFEDILTTDTISIDTHLRAFPTSSFNGIFSVAHDHHILFLNSRKPVVLFLPKYQPFYHFLVTKIFFYAVWYFSWE